MVKDIARIGRRNRRVTIVRAGAATRSARGDLVPAEPAVPPVPTVRWAAVTPVPGTERFASGELAAAAPMRFVFQYRRDLVRVTDALQYEGRTFDVKSVAEVGNRDALEVLAVARGEAVG